MKRFIAAFLAAWIFSVPPLVMADTTGQPRIAFQDTSNVFTGDTNDFYFAGALDQPAPPVASQGATTGGSGSAVTTYRLYVSYYNATGETQLSPPSVEFKPASGLTNIITVTRPTLTREILNKISVWHAWFTRSTDSHATTYACGSGGAILDVSKNSTTTSCLMSVTTNAQEPTSNTTSNVYALRIGSGPDGVFAASTAIREVDICPTGCQYRTLKAACDANTSTATNPILYAVWPGVYTSGVEQTCSGEDYPVIAGAGPSSRIINTATGAGDYGAIGMGTSTNWTIQNLYLKGHRAIIADMASTGGGKVKITNNILETTGADPDEDCAFFRDPAAGTEYNIYNNQCTHLTDGFTNINGATKWFVGGNVFHSVAASSVGGTGGGYAMQAIPSVFIDQGSSFDAGRAQTGAGQGIYYAYWFNGGAAAGGVTDPGSECTSGCYAVIQSPSVRIANTDATSEGPTEIGVYVGSTAAHLANLDIHDPDIKVTVTDAAAGSAYGVYVANNTTAVKVHGGKIRTSGGLTNRDFNHTTSPPAFPIEIAGTDYTTASSSTGTSVSGQDQRRIYASDWLSTGDVPTTYGLNGGFLNILSTSGAPEGLFMDNTSASDNNSPKIKLCDGGTERCYSFYVRGSDDHLLMYDETGAGTFIDVSAATSDLALTVARSYSGLTGYGGSLALGAGASTSTNTFLLFDGASDAQITWFGGATGVDKRLEYTGVEIYRHSTKASPPSSCAIGDQYFDTSGGVCFCTATGTPGTWTNVSGVGNCT